MEMLVLIGLILSFWAVHHEVARFPWLSCARGTALIHSVYAVLLVLILPVVRVCPRDVRVLSAFCPRFPLSSSAGELLLAALRREGGAPVAHSLLAQVVTISYTGGTSQQ